MKHIVFFDLDGVVVKECNVAEFGYGYIFQYMTDPDFHIDEQIKVLKINPKYSQIVKDLRPDIKGKHPVRKMEIAKAKL